MRDRRGLEILVGDTLLNEYADDTVVVLEVIDEGATVTRSTDGPHFVLRKTERDWTIFRRADGTGVGEHPWRVRRGAQPKRPWWRFWG